MTDLHDRDARRPSARGSAFVKKVPLMHLSDSLASPLRVAALSFAVCALVMGPRVGDESSTRTVDLAANVKKVTHKYSQSTSQKKALEEAAVRLKDKAEFFVAPAPKNPDGDLLYASLARAVKALSTPVELVHNPFGDVQFAPVATAASKTPAAGLDPRQLRYEFGSRGIRLFKDVVAVKGKNGLLDAADEKQLSPAVRLAWLVEGVTSDAELAIASLERAMDIDRKGDALFAFLDFWRNNDESFYEALDRTAGSPEGVFHYDAMLFQYGDKFFTAEERKDPGFMKNTRDFTHDKFHDSFLTIRKYKSLIEAIAYSLVLPPDIALPPRLSRFDFSAVSGTSLSVRDQIVILLANANGDVLKVVEFVTAMFKAYPMPDRLASHDGYNPVDVLADKVINGVVVKDVIDKGWTKEWGGAAMAFNRHHDVAVAYREFWVQRAKSVRDAVKDSLGTP